MRSHFLLGTLLAFASHSAFVRGFVVDNTQFYKSLEQNSIDIKGDFTLKSRLTNKYLTFTRQPTGHGGDSKMSIVTQSQPAVLGLEWISSKATSGKRTGSFAGLRISSQKRCVASQYGRSKPDRGGGDVVGVAYSCKTRGDPTIVKAMWFAFDCGSPSNRFVDLLERLRDHDSQKAGDYHWRKNNPGPAHRQRPRNQHRHRKPPHPRSRSLVALVLVVGPAIAPAIALAIALAFTLALAMVIVHSTRIIISLIITVDLKFQLLGVVRMP
ncbi:BZ3500_MvSof-1268-A1-R1_Chr4-2g07041 [Microbotryum saponariae]|uniref:BZ3500_MvSof-1268-A1-R1_Chr4-2g07041 protein n=1 Tax=Microbotryum saponariae TaxID=289078 RepID=A0A2X0NKS5_9BASI|nr:BZ3500_MvSof-1268-A1-R1_Chr4-2g07041 [Microbotryum saponariae]SDA06706.1 BZ3501_MvSof-1269-A2-R1_Chr4-2g06752 [Microbotryum saponariae]